MEQKSGRELPCYKLLEAFGHRTPKMKPDQKLEERSLMWSGQVALPNIQNPFSSFTMPETRLLQVGVTSSLSPNPDHLAKTQIGLSLPINDKNWDYLAALQLSQVLTIVEKRIGYRLEHTERKSLDLFSGLVYRNSQTDRLAYYPFKKPISEPFLVTDESLDQSNRNITPRSFSPDVTPLKLLRIIAEVIKENPQNQTP